MAPNRKEEVKFEQPSELLLMANRYAVVLMALVVILVLAGGYIFLIRPSMAEIKTSEELSQETQELQSKNQDLLAKMKELNVEYDRIRNYRREDLEKLQAVIPTGPQIAELFVVADRLAAKHEFVLDSIDIVDNYKPEQTETVAVPEDIANLLAATSTAPVEEHQGPILKTLLLHLNISRPAPAEEEEERTLPSEEDESNLYKDFKSYLAELEDSLRLMDIETVSFGSLTTDNGSFDISLITYYK